MYLESDVLSVNALLNVDSNDVGSVGEVFCVVFYNGSGYAMTLAGTYTPWDGLIENLPYARSSLLNAEENISVIEGLTGMTGEFEIYLAYENVEGEMIYTASPVVFRIQSE